MSFDQKQQAYYLQELNRAVPTRSGSSMDEKALQLALGSTDPAVSGTVVSGSQNVKSYLSDFSSKTNVIARDTECRGVQFPGSEMRAPDARAGCGWWFSPDPTVPSTAAYGTRRGPMSPTLDTQIGAGQWIWDTEEAYMLEGIKAAATVLSCPDLQYSRFPNLGWCTTTNRAVLTDGNGNPAFPQVAGGDCPGANSIVMNAASCPPPPPPSSGASTLSGANGPAALCAPTSSGALSPSCLQSLANTVCSSNGFLSQTLGTGYASSSDDFMLKNKYLTQRGFQLSSGILNDGVVSADAVLSNIAGLKAVANAGDGSRAAGAALNFCYGTPFDPCVYAATDVGPFDSTCITQTATALGYGQAGKLMPANGGMSYWNDPFFATWSVVVDMLIGWKAVADVGPSGPLVGPTTVGPATQANAIANVYGVTVKQPKLGCNTTGISMQRYLAGTWFDPTNLYPVAGANTAYLGRFLFNVKNGGFPFTAASMSSMTPVGSFAQEAQRMSTVFVPPVGGSYTFLIICNSGGRFTFNNEPPVALQGFNTPNPIFPQNGQLIAGQSYPLIIDLWNNVLPWSFAISMSIDMQAAAPIPPSMLFLPQDRRLPTFELAFNKMPASTAIGPVQDTYGLFENLQLVNTSIGQVGGKQCMVVTGPGSGLFNRANYIQGTRLRAFKTITLMAQINTVTYTNSTPTPSIVGFYNLPDTNTAAYPRKGLGPTPYTYGQRTADFMLTTDGQTIYPWGIQPGQSANSFTALDGLTGFRSPVQQGQWFHLALVWDDDATGYTLYMNGSPGSHITGFTPYDVTQIMENMVIGCDNHPEGQNWTGGLAWFRTFDYRLSPADVTMDMNDNWSSIM
jgi:hypothetical protein